MFEVVIQYVNGGEMAMGSSAQRWDEAIAESLTFAQKFDTSTVASVGVRLRIQHQPQKQAEQPKQEEPKLDLEWFTKTKEVSAC